MQYDQSWLSGQQTVFCTNITVKHLYLAVSVYLALLEVKTKIAKI